MRAALDFKLGKGVKVIDEKSPAEIPRKKQLNWAYLIPGQIGITACTESDPGEAKTTTMSQLAEVTNRWYLGIYLSQWAVEDLDGIPVPKKISYGDVADMLGIPKHLLNGQAGDMTHVQIKLPDARLLMAGKVPSICLVDEIKSVDHERQAAALKLLCDGLGPNCWMFAAGNPVTSGAAGVELTAPAVNRMCVVPWEFDTWAHDTGLRDCGNYPAADLPIVPPTWRNYLPKWGILVADYLRQHGDRRRGFPTDEPSDASQPWASPRTWSYVADALAAGESVGAKKSVMSSMIYGLVGKNDGVQFWKWVSDYSLPDPEYLLKNPKASLPGRGDLLTAITKSVIAVVQDNSTPERWEAARDFVENMWDTYSQDIAMACRGRLWKALPQGYMPTVRTGPWREMDTLSKEIIKENV